MSLPLPPLIAESPVWRGGDACDAVHLGGNRWWLAFGDTFRDPVIDEFDRADAATLDGGGWEWELVGAIDPQVGGPGAMGVASGRAVATGIGTGNYGGAVVDTGRNDHAVYARLTLPLATHRAGVMVRYSDPRNYVYLESKGGSATWTCHEVVDGVASSLATGVGLVNVSGADVLLEAEGSTIRVWVDWKLAATYTTRVRTGSRAGMWFNSTMVSDPTAGWDRCGVGVTRAGGAEGTGGFVRNTAAVASPDSFVARPAYGPFQVASAPITRFCWPIHAYRAGDKVVTIYTEQTDHATIMAVGRSTQNPDGSGRVYEIVPSYGPHGDGSVYGRGSVALGTHRYVAGSRTVAGVVHTLIGREPLTGGPLTYWSGDGWSSSPGDAVAVLVGGSATVSMHRFDRGGYGLVTKPGGFYAQPPDVHLFWAPDITGPYSDQGRLLRIPELDPAPSSTLTAYNARVVAVDEAKRRALVFYNVGSEGPLAEVLDYYGPRLVEVPLPDLPGWVQYPVVAAGREARRLSLSSPEVYAIEPVNAAGLDYDEILDALGDPDDMPLFWRQPVIDAVLTDGGPAESAVFTVASNGDGSKVWRLESARSPL